MAIAATLQRIVWEKGIRGDTKAHFIEDMRINLVTAGWVATGISGGWKFAVTSPQGLKCKVKVYDRPVGGAPDVVTIQWLSEDESRAGFQHVVYAKPGRHFQLWANKCSMYLSVAGLVRPAGFDAHNVQGGIPFCPELEPFSSSGSPAIRDLEGEVTTEAWWSCGDGGSNNWRWAYSRPGAWSACYNGSLMNTETHGGYSNVSTLRWIPVTIDVNVDTYFGLPARTLKFGGDPLYLDPLIAWGLANTQSIARVRGQQYDAIMPSADTDQDLELELFGENWVNYMHDDTDANGSRWSSLLLLIGPPGGTGGSSAYAY